MKPETNDPRPAYLQVADELRDIRNGCDMSLEDVCGKLRWQQSKLSRMENGQQCISDVDLGAVFQDAAHQHIIRFAAAMRRVANPSP